ncbi:ataxin-7-like protein 1 [Sinocyclocheilus grahami]|uniref:Ataxin 7 like 1 n=1 Tax=Sinocyclocheilus grahami TaxID=75366 RepID=A0A672TBI5_SINGR|nr:PREDICTED: ataxin-7-like protein 1 [Sinocyclocheilus grahami]XP_016134828.1 PREDICTED: ataxin-7-like protein 1 [Sinocyclocheilus grahami]XP_016134829.1 PREDICTED: ataxin-7-like protein 1 [Sinocyclocheilus grahami]XP_016134830.1 PREDICTED: ataxin-7-like protein 1 [Sinocyclocheilus grahami]
MHSKNQRRHCSPSSSRTPLVPVKAKMSVGQSEVEALPFRVPCDYPHSRFSKAPLAVYPPKGARAKACVSLPVVSLEKMPCFSRTEGAHIKVTSTSPTAGCSLSFSATSSSPSSAPLKSSLTSPASHKNQEKFLNGRGPVTPRSTTPPSLIDRRPSPSRSPLEKRPAPSPSPQDRRPAASTSPSPSPSDRRPIVPPSPPDKKHQNGAKGGRHRRVSGRVFDPNKHCGVLDPETKRPCTRSLTCKTHSLTHRRAVLGRRKDFNILLAEHKGRAKEKETGQKKEAQAGSQSVQVTQLHDAATSLSTSCSNAKTTPTLKLQLANSHLHRASGAVVFSSAPVPPPEPVPGWQHLSSDEGETDLPEESERLLCHYSPQHPRPLSCCAFSSRLMGRGHYVFDRRWDRVRLALHCMVEKHVNSLMWRKVPLAVESVTSPTEVSPLGSPFVSSHALTAPLDGVSMVSYSTSFSHNGGGVFCIRDPEPRPRPQRNKPAKPPKASGDGTGSKKRKAPPASESRKSGTSGNSYHLPLGAAHISNGTAALSVRAKQRPGGQGPRDQDRDGSVELSLPQALTGDHGGVSSHSPLPYGSSDGRKRKSSGSSAGSDKPSKSTKSTALDGIFRKSSSGLLSSAAESPHSALPRQPKVPH